MRPASQTSSTIIATVRPIASAISPADATPMAIRIGIRVGAKTGIIDMMARIWLWGSDGRIEMPRMYGRTITMSAGVLTPATSSWRETSAPSEANMSAYAVYPNRNQTRAHTTTLAAIEVGNVTAWVRVAVIKPAAPTAPNW